MITTIRGIFPLQPPQATTFTSKATLQSNGCSSPSSFAFPSPCLPVFKHTARVFTAQVGTRRQSRTGDLDPNFEGVRVDDVDDVEDDDELEDEKDLDGPMKRFRRRGLDDEQDYDRDPEFAEILGNCLDDPEKAQSRMEERLREKRHRILHTKTGSANPMNVTFRKFSFSNSYIWFEFYNAPLQKDIRLICDAIRSWHIVGRLGGCNSMNMQLSQSSFEKRPTYDAVLGANVEPATFYNIGDFEVQDNVARIWVDIGTSEPLILDVLINALTQISSDYVGIKQVTLGGTEFENWKESLTSEDVGYSLHKI
ncbi:hypothetical protein V2J09_004073 [Rumex salicifolius]